MRTDERLINVINECRKTTSLRPPRFLSTRYTKGPVRDRLEIVPNSIFKVYFGTN